MLGDCFAALAMTFTLVLLVIPTAHAENPVIIIHAEGESSNETHPDGYHLTAKDLDHGLGAAIPQALNLLPGIHVDRTTGGGVSSLYIRGAEPNYGTVTLDGVEQNAPLNSRGGALNFSGMSTQGILEMRVLSGPRALRVTPSALSGIIELSSASQNLGDSLKLGTGYSRYENTWVEATASQGLPNGAASLAALAEEAGPFEDESEIRNGVVAGTLSVIEENGAGVTLSTRYTDRDTSAFPDDSGGAGFSVIREREVSDFSALSNSLEIRLPTRAGIDSRIAFHLYRERELVLSPGVAPGVRDPVGIPAFRTNNDFLRSELEAETIVNVASNVHIRTSVVLDREGGESSGVLSFDGAEVPVDFLETRTNGELLVETAYFSATGFRGFLGTWVISPESFADRLRPYAGVDYIFPKSNAGLLLGVGRGFKEPSLFALGHPIVGNPSLIPESSTSFELELRKGSSDGKIIGRVTTFANEFQNAIDLDEGPPPLLVNRDAITTRGVEASLDMAAGSMFRLRPSLTYVDADIDNSIERLRNRPRWQGSVLLQAQLSDAHRVSLEALHVGARLDSSIPTGDRNLPSYTKVDLNWSWRVSHVVELEVSVRNVFDERYEDFIGFQGPGVSPFVGLTAWL